MKITAQAKIDESLSSVEGTYNVILMPYVHLGKNMNKGSAFYDVSDVSRISISFQIDLNINKNFGINGATISLVPLNIPVSLVIGEYDRDMEDQEYNLTLNLDTSKIRLELNQGSSEITLKSINLYLTEDFKIDYEKSSIEGNTL